MCSSFRREFSTVSSTMNFNIIIADIIGNTSFEYQGNEIT